MLKDESHETPNPGSNRLPSRKQKHIRRPEPESYDVSTSESAGHERISEGTFFESSNNVQIFGGQFSTTRGHHTNLTINFNHPGDEGSSEPSNSDSGNDSSHYGRHSESPQGTPRDLHTSRDWPISSSLPSRKSSEIYYRHLATKERGSPLWVPEPNNMLPVEYQTQGIGIGDVGIITDYGGFDFLFNMCVSQSNPINPADMPEGFSPLHPPLVPTDIRGYSEYKSDSYIASAFFGTSQRDAQSTGLIFECSASEGAILTLPNGSNSKDVGNLVRFRRYASANAENWYKYVNEVRGREARNGDVRLVIGYDSTTSWGMATFANLSEQRSFRLMFKPIGETSLGRAYGWEYSGIADVRSGPDVREVERLRSLNHANDQGVYENQCLFVRTLNITLQDHVWNRLAANWEMSDLDDYSDTRSSDQHRPSSSSKGSLNRSNESSWTGSSSAGRDLSSTFIMHNSASSAQNTSPSTVRISHTTPAVNVHPSQVINKLLLLEKPDAKMAITGDWDWISVLEQTEEILPPAETLFQRIICRYDICEEDGVVFLEPKKQIDGCGREVVIEESLTFPGDSGLRHYPVNEPPSPPLSDDESVAAPQLPPGMHLPLLTQTNPSMFSQKTTISTFPTYKNMTTVQDRLFLGNIMAARSTRSMAENRITHVLSVCSDSIPAELPESGVIHQRINVEDVDNADLLIHLPASCHFIEGAITSGGSILVHSVQGLSRSAVIVAAYIMYSRRINANEAIDVIKKARSQIWLNPGFLEQLILFELCRYEPSINNGIYVNWRSNLDHKLHIPVTDRERGPDIYDSQAKSTSKESRLYCSAIDEG